MSLILMIVDDEMGLGKTVQVAAQVGTLHESGEILCGSCSLTTEHQQAAKFVSYGPKVSSMLCIVDDKMGLAKTVQVWAHLGALHGSGELSYCSSSVSTNEYLNLHIRSIDGGSHCRAS